MSDGEQMIRRLLDVGSVRQCAALFGAGALEIGRGVRVVPPVHGCSQTYSAPRLAAESAGIVSI